MKSLRTVFVLGLVFFSQLSLAGFPGFVGNPGLGLPVIEGEPVLRGRPLPMPAKTVEAKRYAQVKIKPYFNQCNGTIEFCPAVEPFYELALELYKPVLGQKRVVVSTSLGLPPQNLSLGNITVRDGDVIEIEGTFELTLIRQLKLIDLKSAYHIQR